MARTGPRRWWRRLAWLGLAAMVAYAGFTAYRVMTFYAFVKGGQLMSDGIFEYDAELGFAPHRGSHGTMMLPLPPDVPVRYDDERLRIADQPSPFDAVDAPTLLALGCSVTHGDACAVEDTFAFRAAAALGARPLNAGFPAYGLAQMLVRARDLIPRLRPTYVVVEYAPWLVTRATSELAPTFFGVRPQPYFVDGADGTVALHPPVFAPAGFGLPVAQYRATAVGVADFVSFAANVALPMLLHDDADQLRFRLRQGLGQVRPPAADRVRIVEQVYKEISRLSAQAGSRMIVFVVGMPRDQPAEDELAPLRRLDGVVVVEVWRALLERLPDREAGTFLRVYGHYRGDPPRLIDPHPNPLAHTIIAEEIVRALRAPTVH